mgnify:CR=1 FL=1
MDGSGEMNNPKIDSSVVALFSLDQMKEWLMVAGSNSWSRRTPWFTPLITKKRHSGEVP